MWFCECSPITQVTGSPLPGIPLGHNPFLKAFPWGKVARASHASARRMRATCLSLWERCPRKGAERANLPSQSLRDSSPRGGAKGGRGVRIATPVCATLRYDCHRQSLLFQIRCAEHHWFAMTTFYFGVHNVMRDTNRRLKMQNALRRKAGGRMGYEIQGFPTGMSVFSRMA